MTKTQKQIEKFNAMYLKATENGRRMMILKDALEQVEAGKVKPVHSYGDADGFMINQESLHKGLACDACAAGAIFLSAVRFRNQFNDGEVGGDEAHGCQEFSREQMAMIDCAFEATDLDSDFYYGPNLAAIKFGQRYKNDKTRMKAILKNMIRNKTLFKP